jgi:hypothetical protein
MTTPESRTARTEYNLEAEGGIDNVKPKRMVVEVVIDGCNFGWRL